MTISNLNTIIQYTSTGTTGPYAFTFPVVTGGIKVIVTDTAGEETLLSSSQYTVTYTSSNPLLGGSVTTTSAVTSGYTVTILRNTPKTQASDFTDGMPTLYKSLENGLDKLTMEVQDLQETVSRAPLLKSSTDISSLVLPDPEASKYIGWNPTATGLENKANPLSVTSTGVSTLRYLSEFADFATALSTIGGSTATTLFIDTGANITDDTISTSNIDLVVTRMGGFNISSGKTLTVSGTLTAGRYLIFSGLGTVAGLKEAPVEWFGAVGDGTTSDKTAIEATFAAAYKIIFTQGKEYNADGANLTQVGRTLTGGGTIKDSYLLIGPTGTTRLDMDLHIDGLKFVYTSLGDSQPGLRLRNCRQYTISNCYFENTDRSIEYLPIDSIQNDGKGTISNNIFENVNYCVYNDVTALTVAYLVADVHYINNISTARKTHLYIPLQDGMIISKNTMFFPSYTTSDATKERHIYSSGSNWLIITENNLFESGLESIYLGEPRTYKISNNLIAWSGQRLRSSAIKIVKASTPTLAQSGTISDNQILYGSLYGIDLGQYVRQVDVDNNRIFGMGEEPTSGVYYGGEAAVPYYHIYVYSTDNNISITNNIGKNDTAGTASYSMPTVSQAYFNVVKNNTQLLSGSRMETISLARTYTATGTDTEYDASGFDTLYISPSSGTTVTAIGGVFNGKIVNIWSSNSNLTLDSDYTGTPSSGYYKFNLKAGSNVTLTAGQMVRLEYHSDLSKWLEISRNF